MSLSSDLISQFVKATKDNKKTSTESTVYGTAVEQNGDMYVQLDGSDVLTPVTSTVKMEDGERVVVTIKDHSATVTGNVTTQSARSDDVDDVANEITRVEILVADKVDVGELNAEKARIDQLVAEDVTIKGRLTASEATISEIEADNVTINETLTAQEATINKLSTEKLDANVAQITYATIENLKATDATINNLEATYGDFVVLTTNKFTAIEADIGTLETDKLSATEAELKYANIDFANIGKAAIEEFFSKSGMIDGLVVGDGTITGTLVGVTIKGDLIEGNTVVAEKLVVKGSDGLYYKLNTDGVKTEAEQTDYNSLNGSVITAKSITATKISVDDLVAFDATIGGFHITDSAIYSGVKETVDNTTRGVYLDNDGQVAFGDETNYLKYYKDTDGTYKLAISAGSFIMSVSNKSVEEGISDATDAATEAQGTADTATDRVSDAEAQIQLLKDSLAMLIVDENGGSLMTQSGDGWTFNIGEMRDALDSATLNIESLTEELGGVDNTVSALEQAVSDLGVLSDYVIITTYNNQPCIELGEAENGFKLRITNTQIQFLADGAIPAWLSNQKLYIEKAEITDELQFGTEVNLVPESIDIDGTVYSGGAGYLDGYRLNSSGTVTAYAGSSVTGYIPAKLGMTLTARGIGWDNSEYGTKYLCFYDASFVLLEAVREDNWRAVNACTTDGDIVNVKLASQWTNDLSATAYIRISGSGSGSNYVVTLASENDGVWIWRKRNNGNLGLSWKGVGS